MKALKILGGLVAVLVLIVAGFAAFVWSRSEAAFAERMPITSTLEEMPATVTDVEHGEYLFTTRGCGDCHGTMGAGGVVIDAPPMGKIVAPNLTRGNGGLGDRYLAVSDWDVAVRHGVTPEDGRKLRLMPSYDWAAMADSDLRALVAYIRSLPDVDSDLPPMQVGPIPRVMHTLGKMDTFLAANVIDHAARPVTSVEVTATVEYGAYVATTCIGCHGPNLSGGPVPGGDPSWPPARNLTPDETGLAGWSAADLRKLFREGIRPDGSEIHEIMRAPAIRGFSDVEIEALWLYLSQLEPRPFGGR